MCIYFLIFWAVQVAFIWSASGSHPEKADSHFSRVSYYQHCSCNIWYGRVPLSVLNPSCCNLNGCVPSGIRNRLTCARPRSSSEHTFHPAHSDLGTADIAASQPDVIKLLRKVRKSTCSPCHLFAVDDALSRRQGETESAVWVRILLFICGKCKSRKSAEVG